MFKLYYHNICPMSRLARLLLQERQYEYQIIPTNFWQREKEFLRLNPTGELPVLLAEEDSLVIKNIYAFIEYFITLAPNQRPNIGESEKEKAETRYLIYWFTYKIYHEVTSLIVREKLIRYYTKRGYPDGESLRAAKANLHNHLNYCEFLLKKNSWLAGEFVSIADFAASAQFSILDYLNEIVWRDYPNTKQWYALIKSRPSFRVLLEEKILGFPASSHYTDLDF